MFDFDAIINRYVDRCRPTLMSAKDVATLFMTGVIERLDRIADGVADDSDTPRLYFDLANVPCTGTVVAGTLVPVDLTSSGKITGPLSDEEWHLEAWSGIVSGAIAYILVDGVIVARSSFPQNTPPPLTGVVIPPGRIVQVAAETGGATSMSMRLQFRVHKKQVKGHATAGQVNPTIDRMDDRQESALERRHAGTFTSGRSTQGERVSDL